MVSKTRYYFEILSLPAFIILALHLANSGLQKLMGGEHSHEHGHQLNMSSTASIGPANSHGAEALISIENVIALFVVAFFVWVWHTASFKQWVPCSHTHCHKEQRSSHIIASIALCAHFFPEAEMRQMLLLEQDFNAINIASSVGFISHFIVDVVIAIFLSLYWEKRWQFWLSLAAISSVWIATSLFAASHAGELFSNAFTLLVSSFLLAMFIHKPHSGSLNVKKKHSCDANELPAQKA